MKDAQAAEVQRLNEEAEKIAKLRAEKDAAAAATEAAEDEEEAKKAAIDNKKISDLEAIVKKNAKAMEDANNIKRNLKEAAEEHKRNAE